MIKDINANLNPDILTYPATKGPDDFFSYLYVLKSTFVLKMLLTVSLSLIQLAQCRATAEGRCKL